MEKDFCKFLIGIGLIDEDTSSTFIKIYNEVFQESPDVNIFELSFQILSTFLNNITNTQKNYLCHNLPLKYLKKKKKNRKDKLISIIIKNKLRNKIILLKYLYKWKNAKKQKKNKNINNFNKFSSLITLYKKNLNNTNSNNSYKYINSNYFSNTKLKEEKYKNIKHDAFSYDNTVPKNSTPQLYLSETIKNRKSYSGLKGPFKNINEYNCKNINKSASEDKVNSSKRKRGSSYNSSSTIDVKTTLAWKEENELKECTFKPKINNLKQNSSISQNRLSNEQREKELQLRFDKLYHDDQKYRLTKEMKALELERYSTKDLTFNPSINKTPNLLKDNRKGKFENRIQKFIEKKNKNSEQMKKKIDKEFEQKYSFTPKINSPKFTKTSSNVSAFSKTFNEKNESSNNNYIPAYIRLYEESKLRSQKKMEKEKEIDEHITNMANSLYKQKAEVNYDKINELYENKEKNKIYEKTKNKVESEEGITFKPYIYKNKLAKNINSNFYERNIKFLLDKEKYINLHQNLLNPKSKISQNEKKKIIKNIINRLYNESGSGSHNIGYNNCIKNFQTDYDNNLENKINYDNTNN